MSDIDFQIYDIENELEKRRNEKPDSLSVLPRTASSSRLGCGAIFIRLIIGLVLLRLILEIVGLLFK